MNHAVKCHGFMIVPRVIEAEEARRLVLELGPVAGAGRRGLLALPAVAELARSPKLLDLIRPYFPSEPFPVRAIYFDKSPAANWLVPWHQDLTLAMGARTEVPGFGPWSVKDGIPHVQPPLALLQQMLAVRLHFDETDESNGALRVLPGSHSWGRLSTEEIQTLRGEQAEFLCAVFAGDALLMRPLLLHASGRSSSARHRRILHIEYAAFSLPGGLVWHEATGDNQTSPS